MQRALPALRRPGAARPRAPLRRPTSSRSLVSTSGAASLELIRRVRDLLLRYPVLPRDEAAWMARLDAALARTAAPRPARVIVVGDRNSGAPAFVTAAFDDPLSSNGEVSLALAFRRLGSDVPEAVTLSYSPAIERTRTALRIPSSWLSSNNVELVEIVHGDLPPTQRSLDLVYESDVTVLLLDSLRLLSPPALKALLSEFSSKPNLHLLLDASDADNTATLRTVNTQLDSLNLRSPSKSTVSVISSAGAMSALEALSPDDPATPVDFLAFERGYLASGITGVKDQLARAVQPIRQRTEDGTTSQLQLQTAQYVLERTIETAAFEGAKIADGLKDGEGEIAALALKVSEVERNALDALEVSGGMMKLPKEELNAIAVDLERLFEGRLAWWKLPMRTDVINAEIAHAMERTFLVEFEDRLIFNAGRLIGLQSKLAEETDKMFSTAPFSPTNTSLSSLHSPVLRNKVAQAATETACLISPTELTSPLLARRMQITAPGGPAETLQSRAQKLVLSSGMVTSTAVAGVFFAEVMSAGNAFGAGMLGITLSGWLLQRGWIKARRKFLVDVQKRVVGGLEMDLGSAAQLVIDRSLYPSRVALHDAGALHRTKSKDFASFNSELSRLVAPDKESKSS